MLWQDFFHNERTIQFSDLLFLFVGEAIGIRFEGKSEKYINKAPIFYSGLMPMRCGNSDRSVAERLNGMMDDRFTIFSFGGPLPVGDRRPDWPKCGKCVATYFLRRHDQPRQLAPSALRHH